MGTRDGERAQKATDPRIALSRERVLTATLELLTEFGVGGVTVDDIAKRSGVAKTTIYRHWQNRTAIVTEACARLSGDDQQAPDTGSLEGDVTAVLSGMAKRLFTERWAAILPSVVDAAERDPQIAGIHRDLQATYAAPLRVVLERAVGRGELPPGADLDAIGAALRGPLYFRRWYSHEPIDDSFVALIVRGALAGARSG